MMYTACMIDNVPRKPHPPSQVSAEVEQHVKEAMEEARRAGGSDDEIRQAGERAAQVRTEEEEGTRPQGCPLCGGGGGLGVSDFTTRRAEQAMGVRLGW